MLAGTLGSLPLAKGMIPLWLLFQASCLPLTWSWLWIILSGSLCMRKIPRAGECWADTAPVTLGRGTRPGSATETGLVWVEAMELCKDHVGVEAKG